MKYILVTGAGGGMGSSAVEMLRSEGYTVFALDTKPILKQERVIPLIADVTDMDSLQRVFDCVRQTTDVLYGIVHFAGIYMLHSLIEIPESEFVKAFDINVFGAYRVNRIFAPLLHRGSRIILTTSELAALEPLPFTGLYAVTKSTLDRYAASLRMELQLLGIGVSVLRSGAVKTNMLSVSTNQLDHFCTATRLYSCNATRFRKVVNRVESKNIPTDAIAKKVCGIMRKKRIRPVYNINRNPLLLLLNLLPVKMQMWIIRMILK